MNAYRRFVDGESAEVQGVLANQRIRVELTGCMPDGDEFIVRTCATVHDPAGAFIPKFAVSDMRGNAVNARTVILGCTDVSGIPPEAEQRREVMASIRVSRNDIPCRIRVSDLSGNLAEGSRALNARRMHRMLAEWDSASRCAWDDSRYALWSKRHQATQAEIDRQTRCRFDYEPVVSIIVPLYRTNPEFFRHMIASVFAQSYRRWELVLVNGSPDDDELAAEIAALSDERVRVVELAENEGIVGNTNAGIETASGDFIAFLDHDDFLAPDALYQYVRAVNDDPECDVLYCDEDSYTPGGRFVHPHFKSDFNRDLLYTHNYITHFLMIRADVVRKVGLSPVYVEGAQDYDLTLRAIEVARAVVHVPRVLYHWRVHPESTSANAQSKSYAQEAGRRALEDHFARRGLDAQVWDGVDAFTYIEEYARANDPLVSIVIPNKDHVDVLSTCIGSLLNAATYRHFEIVIVENNSVNAGTFSYYDEIAHDERVRVVRFDGPFNYSKVINYGVSQAHGDYLLLLNNDTEVITPDFMEKMLGYFEREEVGVVGARLLHYDDTVQHAGVVVGPFDEPWHVFIDAPASYPGYMCRARLAQNYLAVTGACQMVKRATFDELGGYDESFAIAYNDVDFCLKAREAGLLVVYAPQIELYHREFTSRGRDVSEEAIVRAHGEKALLHARWPRVFVKGDPYYNPNLKKDSLFFTLGD